MWTTKLDRAKQLETELQTEIKTYFDSHPYEVGTKTDSQSQRLIYYVAKADKVPQKLALLTGDVIQNLRSSLDHLAYLLYTMGPGNGTQGNHIYFPIAQDRATYEKEKHRKTAGMSQAAMNLIDSVKPYKSGNDLLWKIHELNRIDKHRLLVTVGSSYRSMDIGAHIHAMMIKEFPDIEIPIKPIFFKPADTLFPLKVGAELFVDEPNAQPIPDMQFRFDVVLNEPGIVEGEYLVDVVHSMVGVVDGLVPTFAPLISK
jgi:hypothetical protein